MNSIDHLLFGIFPYVAVVVAVVGGLWRFTSSQFTFSSLSSQFLEGRQLFWGSFPWHFGIGLILIGHLIGVFLPSGVKWFNGVPMRLYILEGTALALGLLALTGITILSIRRITNPRIRMVTSKMDVVLLLLLFVQVLTGIGTAIFFRWGSFWFVDTATPYLWSLATLSPSWEYMSSMPWTVKVHAADAFVLVAVFPFTRLVHMVSLPLSYLWRPYQKVIWNWPGTRNLKRS